MSDDTETTDMTETEDNGLARNGTHSAGAIQRRGFAETSVSMGNAATEALIAQARAGAESRWIMAMRKPRQMDDVRQNIIAECKRPGFAEVAVYARPVGREKNEQTGQWEQKFVEGLSIRFAEIAARCMGNLQPDVQTIYDSATDRIVRVTVTDYESNLTWSRDLTIKKTVERKQLKKNQRALGERTNSYGDRVFIVEASDDEVNVKEAAMISKTSRTLILRIVPGEIKDEAFRICKAVKADKDAKDPAAGRKRMLDAFAEFGIKPSSIEQYLGHPIAETTKPEYVTMSQLISAIREGEITWAEAMRSVQDERDQAAGATAKGSAPLPTSAAAAFVANATAPLASSKAKSAGKGTAAAKEQIKGKPAPAPANATPPEPKQEQKPEPKAESKPPPAQPGFSMTVVPRNTEDDEGELAEDQEDQPPQDPELEERACGHCGVPLECPKTAPPGVLCYACSRA